MSASEILAQIILYLAAFGCAAAVAVGYTKARAGAPLVTLSPLLLVWAILVLFALAYWLPEILAGPQSGRDSCAYDTLGGGCLFWTVIYPMAPLLLPTLVYFVAYSLTRSAPAALRQRFERIDRWLESESGGGPGEAMRQNHRGIAHLHAQEIWHDEAYLLSDRAALLDIRNAIDAALSSPDGVGRAEIFAGDGEGYTLFVLLARDGELESSETPYTSADAFDPRPAAVHPAALLIRRRKETPPA